jgi:K+-sensing histidine kinase KdpD
VCWARDTGWCLAWYADGEVGSLARFLVVDRGLLRRTPAGWVTGVALVAAATATDGLLHAHIALPSLAVLYLLVVVLVAVVWGIWPAVMVAVLSMLVYDYLFVPPPFAFTPGDPRSWPALPVFVLGAVAGNEFAARSRRRARESNERLLREAVEAEALRRSDMTKTAILRTVSHDLRTPLMAILTAAGALAQPGFVTDEADRADLVATVLEETHRLDRLVTNLLDLSRLEAGAAEPLAETVAVGELIADTVGSLGTEAERVRVLPGDRAFALADGHHVQRILVNLIENALKYSPPSEQVQLQVTSTAPEVLIRVIDHGPGIPHDEALAIFGAFRRGAGSRHEHGVGLGLAIAAGFAEVNGGKIWVEPHDGRGATFVIALPAKERM